MITAILIKPSHRPITLHLRALYGPVQPCGPVRFSVADNVRQTFARLLLINTNVPLFVKNDFKIPNYSADNALYPARNCVESIHWAGTVLFHRCKSKIGRISCVCDCLHDATGLGFERGQYCCEFVNSIKYTFAHIFSKVTFFYIRNDKVNIFQYVYVFL